MSQLRQFGSGRLKQVLRGTIAMTGTSAGTATLSPAVDTSKAVVTRLGVRYGLNVGAQNVWLTLSSGSTLTATRDNDDSSTTQVSYQVAEYY